MMEIQPNVVLVGDEARILYNVEPQLPKGAFIQHIDGKLYTTDQWSAMGFTNDEANGVAVISDNAKFVIAKTSFDAYAYKADIDAAMTLIGGTAIRGYHWSSTQYSAELAWALSWAWGDTTYPRKNSTTYPARAFSAL